MALDYKRVLNNILGNPEKSTFEERLVSANILFSSFATLASTFVNINLGLAPIAVAVAMISSIFYLFLYALGRFYYKKELVKWLFSIYTLIAINFLWVSNNGSKGSASFYIVIYYFIMIFAWDYHRIKIITVIVFLNIIGYFYIEATYTNFISEYPSYFARVADSYTTLIFLFGAFIIIFINAKNNYIKQTIRAQESDRLKSTFLANMSHEIRTPLNSVIGFSRLLTKRDLSPEKKEKYVELITDNGNYLIKLVSDILDISLIETGQLKVNEKFLDVSVVCNKLLSTYTLLIRELKKKHVKIELRAPPHKVSLISDEVRIEQILSNLLHNAVKFTDEGKVVFGYYVENNNVVFFIEDTGRGIKEEYQKDLFNRFAKTDDPTDLHFERGAGIGLALSKEMIILLGGTIWFTSKYQEGSTFYASVPLTANTN